MKAATRDYDNFYLSGNLKQDLALFKEIFKKEAAFRVKKLNSAQKNEICCANFAEKSS